MIYVYMFMISALGGMGDFYIGIDIFDRNK